MAKREIVVTYGDEESAFKFTRVDRSKLYGRKERVILDENGDRCVPAYLTADGAALVPPGGTAHVYVDESFNTVERGQLRAVDQDGQPLGTVESTLGVPVALEPVRADRLLDHVVSSVYELSPESFGEGLKKALRDGEIFETVYNYREGYDPDALFLLQTDEGVFGLVAKESGFLPIARETPEAADEEAEAGPDELDEDDFDFSMM